MPSTYAHYRLGQEVLELVTGKEREIIETYPELFDIGLHGPDILFYYHPLTVNPINQIGYGMHAKPGYDFFHHAAKIIRHHRHPEAYKAYVYGFICHFALDVTCHGYIDEKIASSGISHGEIEVEFDRYLMVKDNLNPLRHRLTNHIVPSTENANVIKDFFPNTTTLQVEKALKGMIFNNNLLIAPTKLKRHFINSLLKVSGNYKEMHGLMVNFEKNPNCIDSTKKLNKLYKEAVTEAVLLIHEYSDYIGGKRPLNGIYQYTFGSVLPENVSAKKASNQ